MAVIDDLNSQCSHHGTKADLKPRDRFAKGEGHARYEEMVRLGEGFAAYS